MHQKINTSGYTLVEIVVVVSLIALFAFIGGQMNFSRMTQKQEISIENIRIMSIFQEIRNNAFLGKTVGTGSIIPTSWRIQVSQSNSGRVISEYLSGATWIAYDKVWSARQPFILNRIRCFNLNLGLTGSLTGTGTVTFTGSSFAFTGGGCNNQNHKVLQLELGNQSYSEFIRFNSVTGIIESI